MECKLAVVEKPIVGLDGYVRAVDIRTANGKTNRPIAWLIPLEVNENEVQEEVVNSIDAVGDNVSNLSDHLAERPTRNATIRAWNRLKQWVAMIHLAPEYVMD